MKIALVGYGKMGKAIEQVARERGHEIVAAISSSNLSDFTKEKLSTADVAIEFTNPHCAYANIDRCLQWDVPVVSGSTGWTEGLGALQELTKKRNGGFIYSSNFSIGVNLFFELNKKLATLMASHPEYDVLIRETHHTQKKDAPSGTAITLAEQVLEKLDRKLQWVNQLSDKPEDLEIISLRVDPAPGTHSVKYTSAIDDIEITHTAHNRTGFATGAVIAAEYLRDHKGVFTMKEVLGF